MRIATLLQDGFERTPGIVHRALDGISEEALTWRPAPEANTIAWLVWHLARVQDDHVAEAAGHEQVWVEGAWAPRFGLDEDSLATGFGWSSEQVDTIRPTDAAVLEDYLAAVTERTLIYVEGLDTDELDRIVDEAWDPPVTLGARLVSVLGDDLQHAGQAAYVRGLSDAG